MMQKFFLSVFLFVFIFLASGCTVAKGVSGFGQGMAEGFQEDCKAVQKADNWAKTNLW